MRPKIRVLEDELIAGILAESKRVLAEVGMEIRGVPLRRRLLEYGLHADRSGRILFPPDVVEWAVGQAPESFQLFDRDGQPFTKLGGDRVHFVPGSSGLQILDHRSGKTRPANTADFIEYLRLADGLEHIAYLATAFSTNEDIEAQVADAWRLYLVLTQSRKPVVSGAFTAHGVPRMAEMMALFRRDRLDLASRPLSIFTITATGNFRYGEDSCQNLIDCVEWGIPVEIVPVTIMGLIAPVTPIGAAVFHTVDVLAGLTMAQIVRPGAPVLFGGAPAAFHMQTATSPMIAVEALRLDLCYIEIAKYLGLPTQAYMALSESKFPDAQAGAETFTSALLAALAGVNSVSGPGMLDYLMVFSLPKLVLDNELCGQALQFTKDLRPVYDLPTVDLVRAQLREQHLLTSEHTLEHWPSQLYLPNPVVDRLNREAWTAAGGQGLRERARDQVEQGLAAYQPVHTDSRLAAELEQIIRAGLNHQHSLPEIPPPKGDALPLGRSGAGGRSSRRRHRRAR